MRGAGRTPHGLQAHQQTSRAAGGTTKSVAPTKLAEATPKDSRTRADATQPSARIARRTASRPTSASLPHLGTSDPHRRTSTKIQRSGDQHQKSQQKVLPQANERPTQHLFSPPFQREQTVSHFKGCNEFSRRFGGGVLRIQDPPHLHQQRSSKGARWST